MKKHYTWYYSYIYHMYRCIVHKNCIRLHFYTSCHIKERCEEFFFFFLFFFFGSLGKTKIRLDMNDIKGTVEVRTIAPEENWPPDICPPHNCSLDDFPPDNCPLGDCSRTITPKIIALWQLSTRKIVFRMTYCLHNFLEENCPQQHCPKNKLQTIYFFPQESEMVVL